MTRLADLVEREYGTGWTQNRTEAWWVVVMREQTMVQQSINRYLSISTIFLVSGLVCHPNSASSTDTGRSIHRAEGVELEIPRPLRECLYVTSVTASSPPGTGFATAIIISHQRVCLAREPLHYSLSECKG